MKYLGKASEVVKDDIPVEYRDNPKVLSVLASYNPKDLKKREESTKKSKQQLYKKLTEGNIQDCVKIYQDYTKIFNPADFFDKILKQVMYDIGDDWSTNKISIATEHVASNIAQTLVKIIIDSVSGSANKKKILLCVPVGEEHHLGCDVLETYLSIKGYKVYNLGTSLPTESIISFIDNNKPDIVFVSITLPDNILAGQRLVRKINDECKIPILIGGYAMQSEKIPKFDAKIISEVNLDELPKIIRSV